jgi:hypothetical protein
LSQIEFLKEKVREHLKQYGGVQEQIAAAKRALARDLPERWVEPFQEVVRELEAAKVEA